MLTDEEIIELYFTRDERAVTETSLKYGGQCRRVSYNILKTKEDAEECVNESYLKLWNLIPPERPDELKYYLLKIVRNISLNRLKFLKRRKRFDGVNLSLDELENILPDQSGSPESDSGLTELLNTFLDTLKRDDRIIFLRKYWYFDSVAEITRDFGFTAPKVKTSLFRTREKLRKYLTERGYRI